MTDRPFRDEPTEVLETALGLADTHAQQAARFQPEQPGDELPAVADLFRAELQHREGTLTMTNPPADASLLRTAIERGRRLALTFDVSGNEFIADQIRTALDLDEPATPPSADQSERRDRYAAAIAKRDGHEWPTEFEDDERDYRRRADAAMTVADAEQAAPPSVPVDGDLRTLIRGVIRDCPALYPDDIADRVLAALQSAYRRLLARLEADRAGHLRATARAKEAGADEVLLTVSSTFASAFRHAAAMAVHAFEGPDAAQAYIQRTEGGEEAVGDVVLAILPAPANQAAEERRLRAKVYEWQGSYLDEVKVRQHRDKEIARLRADRAAVLKEAADELAEDDFLLAAEELRRMADEAQQAGEWPVLVSTLDEPEEDPAVRRETVEFFVQSQQPDEAWEQASSTDSRLGFIEERIANLQERFPEAKFRIVQRNTTVVVQPLENCPQCAWGVDHVEHCPHPETHNAGCGCFSDEPPAQEPTLEEADRVLDERVAAAKEQQAGESDCRTPETHNWGCGCPTDPPHRGDKVERWLKQQRDKLPKNAAEWHVIDGVLDRYRLHADTGTLLDQHVCEGQVVGDCDCLEQPAVEARQADTAGEGR